MTDVKWDPCHFCDIEVEFSKCVVVKMSIHFMLLFTPEQDVPKKYENMTQIALLVSVTVCLIILIITSTFVYLR